MGIYFGIYLADKVHATRCSNSNPSLPRLAGEGSDGGGF